jgi:two-component system phosphate regulon sensor histidine kinase PhoR
MLVFYFSNNLMLQSTQKELKNEMRNKWEILALHLLNGDTTIDSFHLIRTISEKTKLRITILEYSGKVIDDSYLEPQAVETLENHRHRPEIMDAIAYKEGYSVRYSATTEIDMVYFARPLNDRLILRISYPATYLNIIKQEFIRQNLNIFLLSIALTILISVYLARKISLPIRKLDSIAQQIEMGKTEIHFPDFSDPTMAKISGMIKRIHTAMINEQVQLQQEQDKLDHVFSILEEGIILVDNNFNVIHFNDKAASYLNLPLKNINNLLSDLNDPEINLFFKDVLTAGQNQVWKSKPLRNKIFEVNLTIHQAEKLIVFFNVTEERKYEQYKSELIENISHELKTPLSMILGYAETILNEPEMAKPMLTRFLSKIFNSSKRINGIINDLLELHKLESTGRTVSPETPVIIAEVIQDLKNRFIDDLTKVIKYYVHVDQLMIHYEHLFSIIANLTDNAVKYSRGQNIDVSVDKEDKKITIRVEDEGPVIPDEEKARIFERFYTVSRSRNKSRSGSGLGLPIVKHIAQLYNGSVTVGESRNNGNVFTVTLYEEV